MTKPVARVDKDELFRLLGYQPHAGQAAMHRSPARYRVLACGVRWGKSVAASMEVIAALLQPAKQARGWIVAPSRDLVDRVFERVVIAFQQQMPHRIADLDERQQRLIIRNLGGGQTEVRGKSAQDPISLLGESLDWVVVEEAARLPRPTWDGALAARLVDRRGWALLISTPAGENWFLRMFRSGQRGRDKDTESWCSPSSANPHLDAELIEEERKRLPHAAFAEQYLAAFVGATSEPCVSCGGPSPTLPYAPMMVTDRELGNCVTCGQLTDPDGATLVKLWPDGKTSAKVLVLRPLSEEVA